jgi:hypothetical protein
VSPDPGTAVLSTAGGCPDDDRADKCIFTRSLRVIVLSSLREGAALDSEDIENWNNQKRGPIEITVEVRECPRCRRVTDEGAEGTCVCVDEALGDLPT